ncbi:MAG: sigma-54-dependent transcriptional regulator [bacterium]
MNPRILIVDDEKNIRRALAMILEAEGFRISEAESGEAALVALGAAPSDLVLLDVNLPGQSGLDTLRAIRRSAPATAVIMISGEATIATAVEATRDGAHDFLEKPLRKERVLLAVQNALRFRAALHEVRALRARDADQRVLLGASAAMAKVRAQIAQVAPTAGRVLILGESGTGKELVARAIHEGSPRADRAFIKVNCAAIPEELIESELFGAVRGAYTGAVAAREGKFEAADGGTLFLDEIADMSLRAQAKVLRALQEGEIERVGGTGTVRVDVRVVAATNKDLPALVRDGKFREDLWFRLNVVPIAVPPLRERRDDIPLLVAHMLERFRIEHNRAPVRIAADALEAFARLAWPGNVRELGNAIERLVILAPGPEIALAEVRALGLLPGAGAAGSAAASVAPGPSLPSDFALAPDDVSRLGGLAEARRLFEAACIREGLRVAGGNISEAARMLGIDRTNLHKKIQAYGLEARADEREEKGS